ncbi:hypothetical protein ATE80_00585 [Streptomyces kanasensis]|uniref:Uncharacterized protein n=1 Tax=Streptomyces kanasensis TaxID=936756 RepID=A0A117IY52_9ACTN|nr:hypothetical protein ATE80_00585 [Streptomyces kanasensis]
MPVAVRAVAERYGAKAPTRIDLRDGKARGQATKGAGSYAAALAMDGRVHRVRPSPLDGL